jgi:hypothetical protein
MLNAQTLNRILVISGALWCAAAVAAGLVPLSSDSAQPPRAESPEPVLAKADREPLPAAKPAALSVPFESRWPQPAVVAATRKDVSQTVGATVSARRHHHRDVDRVCRHHGRRYWHDRPGHLTWRCRR